jgi:transposase-like protein
VPEECDICGETVPFSATVHLIVNTQSDAGTFDRYVCRSCYDAELEPVVG